MSNESEGAGLSALPVLTDFSDATDPARYVRLPAGWALAVADIVGSTKLAASGRHRDVNFVAAAVLAAVQADVSALATGPVASQFGGDGATIAVPPQARESVTRTLQALAHWATTVFDLELRVGLFPVEDIEALGGTVLAALYRVGEDNHYGLFLGNGAALAETLIKQEGMTRLKPAEGPIPGLDELSCRWEPVPSGRGTILCIIADPTDPGIDGARAMSDLSVDIDRIAPLGACAPLGDGSGLVPRLGAIPAAAAKEYKLAPNGRAVGRYIGATLAAFLSCVLYRTGWAIGGFTVRGYAERVARQTDFRKVSTGLRLVLDVSEDEARQIEALLEEAHEAGRIVHGTHRSAAASITCLVFNPVNGKHIHFVDGYGLGLWEASKGYKLRMSEIPGSGVL